MFVNLLLIFATLTVWIAAFEFSSELKTYKKSFLKCKDGSNFFNENQRNKVFRSKTVFKKYNEIKHLCDNINEVFGSLLGVFLVTTIVSTPSGIDSVLVIPDAIIQLRFMSYTCFALLILVIAADICKQV